MNDHSAHPHDEPSSGDGGASAQAEPPDSHEHPIQYFLPGRVMVQINHHAEENPRKLADLIDQTVRDKKLGFPEKPIPGFEGFNRSLIKPVQLGSILTFARRDDPRPAFSIVPVELNSHRQDALIATLQTIYNRLNLKEGPYRFPQEQEKEIYWQAVAPNWLLSSGGHGAPHPPSPGSWPLIRKARKATDWQFSLLDKDTGKKLPLPYAEGAKVDVAILDTAPLHTDLDEAYVAWHDKNELIERLLKPEPNRKLGLVANFNAEIELADCSLARHNYKMGEHGPFIAGEIASIAPEATLHLYKVFTAYGSASTFTLAQGLLRVLTDLRDGELETPLVVNFSGGLAVPEHYDPDFHPDFPLEFQDPVTLQHMQTSLRALFEELANQDQVIVVASAGNDSDPEKGRAPARLPAAYERVIGVGAMPRVSGPQNSPIPTASYSNLADKPPSDGYVTLGGEPRSGNGILGIYTSETPYYVKKQGEVHQPGERPPDPQEPTRDRLRYNTIHNNPAGSGEWAGTSQAAPIVTGLLARWCSEQVSKGVPITLEDARAALDNLSQGLTTAQDEHVILVAQG
jgi:subtilase family protein